MQSQIQITVSAGSLSLIKARLSVAAASAAKRKGARPAAAVGMRLEDMPQFAREELGFAGLNIPVTMLAGRTLAQLEDLRDRADRAGCPILVLVDDHPLDFHRQGKAAAERLTRLAAAGTRLGCGDMAIKCVGVDDEVSMAGAAKNARAALNDIESYGLGVLVRPGEGATGDPPRLMDFIKRIGGFRIGAMPSFAHAAETAEFVATLRRLAPYAHCVAATVNAYSRNGKHPGHDLEEAVRAVVSVGYQGTLCVEFAGEGDPQKHIVKAREAMSAVLSADVDADVDDDDDAPPAEADPEIAD